MTIQEARADLMLAQADISYRPKDDSIDMAIEALENQKIGHWIKKDVGKVTTYKCSECGRFIMTDTGYDVTKDYPYCKYPTRRPGNRIQPCPHGAFSDGTAAENRCKMP